MISLPIDLWLKIIPYIQNSSQDLLALALVNRNFASVVFPFLARYMLVDPMPKPQHPIRFLEFTSIRNWHGGWVQQNLKRAGSNLRVTRLGFNTSGYDCVELTHLNFFHNVWLREVTLSGLRLRRPGNVNLIDISRIFAGCSMEDLTKFTLDLTRANWDNCIKVNWALLDAYLSSRPSLQSVHILGPLSVMEVSDIMPLVTAKGILDVTFRPTLPEPSVPLVPWPSISGQIRRRKFRRRKGSGTGQDTG